MDTKIFRSIQQVFLGTDRVKQCPSSINFNIMFSVQRQLGLLLLQFSDTLADKPGIIRISVIAALIIDPTHVLTFFQLKYRVQLAEARGTEKPLEFVMDTRTFEEFE